MSSLAAARADNFYYPPGWDPSKGSLNKYNGSHGALGDRARKLDQGILVIRFEMPFNVWCSGCSHLIGKGVRFNAEKKQVGAYHSTRIWSFSMTAPCCKQRIEVQTDPKAGEYVVVSGARRKVDSSADGEGTIEVDPQRGAAPRGDPLAALEHAGEDRRRGAEAAAEVAALRDASEAKHRDDYCLNKALRRQLRVARKEEKGREARAAELGLPEHVRLLPESPGDALRAAAVHFGSGGESGFRQSRTHARRQIAASSIFSPSALVAPAPAAGKRRVSDGDAALARKRRRLDAMVKLTAADPPAPPRR